MNTKLALSLNQGVIKLAKVYAKEKNVSLSALVENYLLKIVSDLQLTNSLKGSIVGAPILIGDDLFIRAYI